LGISGSLSRAGQKEAHNESTYRGDPVPITRVLLAALGVSAALSVSMAVSPRPALAQANSNESFTKRGCTFFYHPTFQRHAECPYANLSKSEGNGPAHDFFFAPGTKLSFSNFSGASFIDQTLVGVELVNANLSGAHMWGVNMSGAILLGANLSGVDMRQHGHVSNLSGADLVNANLNGAYMTHVNFSGANLSGAYANQKPVNLMYANLSRAHADAINLDGADLQFADLSHADLGLAILRGAQTLRADFRGVTWNATICPDGTNSTLNTPRTCIGHLGRPAAK
jgi:uncharacterized protein YjbI with pentapeptide repeats